MKKILVVDDDPVILKIIHQFLREKKYWPISALSVKGALKILEEDSEIELIITDIEMPRADAFDLMRHLKQSPRLHATPVIFCSSKGDRETLIKAMKAGARDFIVKPFKAETLIAKVKKVLLHGKPTVLIIEDERDVRHQLGKIIEFAGFSVRSAENAEQGLLEISGNQIDIVIADVGLPEMSGKELAAQIKKLYQNIPVLLITGIPDEMTRELSLAYGAVGYISKPFKSGVITEQLQNVLKTIPA